MRDGEEVVAPLIDWAVAARPCAGETESGDACVVKDFPHAALIAVVDGLGHGAEAARAARAAIAVVESSTTPSLSQIATACHSVLRETRGAAMTLVCIGRDGTMSWLGIGNVSAVLIRRSDTEGRDVIVSRGGLVGNQLPSVAPTTLSVFPGDTLVITTDGVRWDPHDEVALLMELEPTARELIDQYAITTDDALVVVARCR